MKIIHQVHPQDFAKYNTQAIREKFLLENLLLQDEINCTYTHYDRMVIGGAMPVTKALELTSYDALKTENFLDRRELGIVNIGDSGTVDVDGESFELSKIDCLYVGMGKKKIVFEKSGKGQAKFILFSCGAHKEYPTRLMKASEATPAEMGSGETVNHRTINKYIHADGMQSCQLMLGVTNFKQGSIWNTMPPHLHDRRMEAYFYFDLPETQRAIHFMGEPHETRHLFLNNEQGIVSPSWSIHSGVATAAYSFIWAMAGENYSFTDMDAVDIQKLR